jgi:hypothetical protein
MSYSKWLRGKEFIFFGQDSEEKHLLVPDGPIQTNRTRVYTQFVAKHV